MKGAADSDEKLGRAVKTALVIAVGILSGLLVVLLLLPGVVFDTSPQQCQSVFGYTVPCGLGFAAVAGASTVAGIAVLLWAATQVTPFGWTLVKAAATIEAGLAVLLLLFPASGSVGQPPDCSSVLGQPVACGPEFSIAAAALSSGSAGLLLWLHGQRTSRERGNRRQT